MKLLLAVVMLSWALLSPSVAAPPDLTGLGWAQKPGSAVPLDRVFTDQDGHSVTLRDALGGRPAILDLGYFHCPALCGVTRDDLFAALAGSGLVSGKDYTMLFISIDPSETPAEARSALADDLARHPVPGGSAGLRFLVGAQPAVEAVERAVGYRSRYDEVLHQYLHPAGVVLLTSDGEVASYLQGVGYQASDVRSAVERAGLGTIARAASPVLLLCFHFDPSTGRYTLAIMKVLRLFGGLTVLTILGLVLILRRSRRRMG